MLCPVCHKPMVVLERKQIELDHCPKCGGVWFDGNELELFLKVLDPAADFSPRAMLRLPEVKRAHHRKCPLCRHNMRQVKLGNPAILIDVCPQEEGLWFDGGEVHELASQLAANAPATAGVYKAIAFLGETFQARK